ncbi:hypothetical protein D3C86_1930430 [compost metagenome]
MKGAFFVAGIYLQLVQFLWRGSLSDRRIVPLDCVAVVNPVNAVFLSHRFCLVWGCFATRREQAPSPQQPGSPPREHSSSDVA